MRTFQRIARLIRPMIGLPLLSALALAGLLVLALGCRPQREPAAASAPALAPRVADVPVPAAFRFDIKESSDRKVGGLRFVKHLYSGRTPVRQVAAFYRRDMPLLGWQSLEESFVRGRQRFLFEKGNETCYISVWDDWGTKVLIQVFPKEQEVPGAVGPPE